MENQPKRNRLPTTSINHYSIDFYWIINRIRLQGLNDVLSTQKILRPYYAVLHYKETVLYEVATIWQKEHSFFLKHYAILLAYRSTY